MKNWPPQEIFAADISDEDQTALDIRLESMARQIAGALDWDEEQRRKEGLATDRDTHLDAPPSWPTHGCLKNWITALQQARALLKEPQG